MMTCCTFSIMLANQLVDQNGSSAKIAFAKTHQIYKQWQVPTLTVGALLGEGSCHTHKYQTRAQELYNMTFFTLVEKFDLGQSHFH
jgi:hypothetical protein